MENHQQAVLWDMDGVLVDTGEFHYQAWCEVLSQNDIPFDRETFRKTFGMNNFGVLKSLLGEDADQKRMEKIDEDKEVVFRDKIHGKVKPLPGVQRWVKRLKELGYRQAVASSGHKKNIEVLLSELGIKDYFDAMVSAANMAGKPDPTVFLEAAKQVNVPPERCTVVEDAIAGVEAAKKAKMRCVAVTTTNPADALKDADIVVKNLEELPDDYF